MKKYITVLSLFILAASVVNSQQGNSAKKDPAGQWKFEAPYAPEGFTTGVVEVAVVEKKYTATMSFTGSDYKLPGESVKFEKDSLLFSIYVQGEIVNVNLKLEDALKMSGKAVYSEGSVPLTLTKVVKEAGK
jgi:hypothetical protein